MKRNGRSDDVARIASTLQDVLVVLLLQNGANQDDTRKVAGVAMERVVRVAKVMKSNKKATAK